MECLVKSKFFFNKLQYFLPNFYFLLPPPKKKTLLELRWDYEYRIKSMPQGSREEITAMSMCAYILKYNYKTEREHARNIKSKKLANISH